MFKINKVKAFSLIELSIVILIIGILVAGVTQSSRLINQVRLTSARSLTFGSPVYTIKDLYSWQDAVSEKSFIDSEASNNTAISTWYDINPTALSDRINFVQTDNARKPIFISNAINGLPGLYFNGAYFLRSERNVLPFFGMGSATIFMVFIADNVAGQKFMLMHPIANCAKNAEIGIGVANIVSGNFGVHAGCGIGTITNGNVISVSQPTIVSMAFLSSPLTAGTTANIKIFKNGGTELPLVGSGGSYTQSMGGVYGNAISPLLIGLRDDNNNGGYNSGFVGDIGEIIIYSRTLNTEERQAVEKYLSKKWGIAIQ
ncbi:MAG: prepilin-type N-terminal cleavage/methylation domain-containing protein [Alphaproteobacteria bacterium]